MTENTNSKLKDANEFAELLEQLSKADKEKIKYIMIGLKMSETVKPSLTA